VKFRGSAALELFLQSWSSPKHALSVVCRAAHRVWPIWPSIMAGGRRQGRLDSTRAEFSFPRRRDEESPVPRF
jgi:hypothetical protein